MAGDEKRREVAAVVTRRLRAFYREVVSADVVRD